MIPFPEQFISNMQKMLGGDAPAFFAALNAEPALALRINPLRGESAEAAAEPYIEANVPWAKYGRYLRAGARPGAGIAHAAGAFYIQEASAMISAEILNAQPGEYVLDLCAAPGGKATQIAAAMRGTGIFVANEPDAARAKALRANLERMGAGYAVITNAYPDALSRAWRGFFDAIQCDAPCSGEGMFRRDPDARAQWSPASPAGCAKRQAEILDRAAELLAPGGRIVYSTCTFNIEENEDTIRAFLARHPDFAAEDFHLSGVGDSTDGMIRAWPHIVRGDGHFACRLRRAGHTDHREADLYIAREDRALLSQLSEICKIDLTGRRIVRAGEYLFAAPAALPDAERVKIVSRGLCLLRIGKNYIEPAHALAMAIDPADAARRLSLTDAQAVRYLSGEAIETGAENGWTLAVWRGMALGWGKVSGGIFKNHLPKGLRISLHL